MNLNESNFGTEVLTSSEPYLVDFWASWCGPCLMLAPTIEKLSSKYKVGKVNIDESSELASTYGISAIPTMIVFKDGQKMKTIVGLRSEQELTNIMDSLK